MKYILLFSIFLFLLPQPVHAQDRLISLINSKRIKLVKENKILDKSAKAKACDMVKNHYWEHDRPDGTFWAILFNKSGYKYKYAGENLAKGYYDSNELIQAWMKSPEHKKVLQDPVYQEVGIGRCGNMTVAHFGTR